MLKQVVCEGSYIQSTSRSLSPFLLILTSGTYAKSGVLVEENSRSGFTYQTNSERHLANMLPRPS